MAHCSCCNRYPGRSLRNLQRVVTQEALAVSAAIFTTSPILTIRPTTTAPAAPHPPPKGGKSTNGDSAGSNNDTAVTVEAPAESSGSSSSSSAEPPLRRVHTHANNMRQLYRTKELWIAASAGAVSSFGYPSPFVHLVPFAEDRGIGGTEASIVLSMVGLASLCGRSRADSSSRMCAARKLRLTARRTCTCCVQRARHHVGEKQLRTNEAKRGRER